MDKSAVVIGGGVSGLSVAYSLFSQGVSKITVLESASRCGGVIRTLRNGPFLMEAGADAFDGRELSILDLCEKLELTRELLKTGPALQNIFITKNLFPLDLSDLPGVFKSPALNFKARARLLFEPVIPPRKDDVDESIAAFIRRRLGGTVLYRLVQPLARGVLMAEPEKLSLREYFPQWKKMERERGSIAPALLEKKDGSKLPTLFFTIRGGLDRFTGALMNGLAGAEILLNSEAVSLKREKNWKVLLRDGREVQADVVCLAMPSPAAAKLLSGFASLTQSLDKIRYDSIVAVNMIFRTEDLPEKFRKNGFIIPSSREKWPFASLKLIGAAEDGNSIRLRAFISGVFQPEPFAWDDEKIKKEVLCSLASEWGLYAPPAWSSVERYLEALPQYECGHGRFVSDIEKTLQNFKGLFLAGNGYYGFGISDCVREAGRVARGMKAFLETSLVPTA